MLRILVLVLSILSSAAWAKADRMARLKTGQVLDGIMHTGHWHTDLGGRHLHLRCTTCARPVAVELESLPLMTGSNPALWQGDYLTRRRQFCADLVVRGGRCLGTARISLRPNALYGFQSRHAEDGATIHEIVVFYHDKEYGPELLRTRIIISQGATLPSGTIERMKQAMAQLTLFW